MPSPVSNYKKEGKQMDSTVRKPAGNEKTIMIYLLYSFLIAWSAEMLLVLLYKLDLFHGIAAQVIHYGIIGFGGATAPAYAAFLVQRRQNAVTWKEFVQHIFYTENLKKNLVVLVLFGALQLIACAVQESYIGYPWYGFILFELFMIFGGGLEEIGWQGVFMPLLQKRFSFFVSAVIGGMIWSVWHLPLWFVPNATQSAFSFAAFALYCITLRITLAAACRITKSTWVPILLHAWGNTVLGGMYTVTSLRNFPGSTTVFVDSIQVLLVAVILRFASKHAD